MAIWTNYVVPMVFFTVVFIVFVYFIDRSRTIEDLQKKYAKDIVAGEAIFIKGSSENKPLTIIKIMGLLIYTVIALSLVLGLLYLWYVGITDCFYNEQFSWVLFFGNDFYFLGLLCLVPVFFRFVKASILAMKTGWEQDINQSYTHDTVVHRFTRKKFVEHIITFVVFTVILVSYVYTEPNWQLIFNSSSLAEANKTSYQQCMVEREKRLSDDNQ